MMDSGASPQKLSPLKRQSSRVVQPTQQELQMLNQRIGMMLLQAKEDLTFA